jgi:hypothetical protein
MATPTGVTLLRMPYAADLYMSVQHSQPHVLYPQMLQSRGVWDATQ